MIVGLGGTNLTAGAMMAALAVTSLVFALAHAWSGALARSADDRQALAVGHVLDGIRHEWPMVEAVTPALLALGLAALGVYSESTGLWIAITPTPSCSSLGVRSCAIGPRVTRCNPSPPA